MTAQRSLFALLLALFIAAAAPVFAQSWSGELALGVEVENEAGQPVPGARVRVQFAETDAYDGPEAVTTDDAGQAVFYGLNEGLWRIRVERESYSGYMSVIRLDRSKKKVQITAGPLRDASAPPLTVSFQKSVGQRLSPDAPQTREDRDDDRGDRRSRRADRRSERERKRAEKEEQRRADARARGERTEPRPSRPPGPRAIPERAAEPEPVDEPTPPEPLQDPTPPSVREVEPPPATPEPPVTEPPPNVPPEPLQDPDPPEIPDGAAPPPTPTPAPTPPTQPPASPPEARRMPAPKPEMEPAVPPVPEAAPTPPSTATLPPSPVRSGSTGSCADCKPGESAVSALVTSGSRAPGSPTGCPAEIGNRVRQVIETLAAAPGPQANDYAGPLTDGGSLLPWAAPAAQTEAAAALAPYLGSASTCRVALVVLPPSARFAGYRYQAADAQAGGDCLAGRDCPIGDSLWDDHPRIEKTDAGTFIYSVFENRSERWDRRGEMTVYFRDRR